MWELYRRFLLHRAPDLLATAEFDIETILPGESYSHVTLKRKV